jgi:hypothetical protein
VVITIPATPPTVTTVGEQEHAEKRSDARLHVGHEEVQRQQRKNPASRGNAGILHIAEVQPGKMPLIGKRA